LSLNKGDIKWKKKSVNATAITHNVAEKRLASAVQKSVAANKIMRRFYLKKF
tara:strand:- start:396 stop:551 length:156 start_codon:yes stop_codon:yes gene_type:complete